MTGATGVAGQIEVDMFMQVLIERARRYSERKGYVNRFLQFSEEILLFWNPDRRIRRPRKFASATLNLLA